ncbi:MAG: hypothetical protein OXE75_00880 [bacterium]|nr:hypothetical protein [bacterium]
MTQPESLEQAFADVEQEASSALDSTKKLQGLLRQLHKSSREGNVAALKRVQGRLREASTELTRAVEGAAGSWLLGDEEEVGYLREGYAAELIRVAAEQGLEIHETDGQLISHPSTVRILAGDRAVRIDRKKVSTIRPSHLVELLRKNQNRPARFRPEPFLKALHEVYTALTSGTQTPPGGVVIPLDRIYRLLTSLPGSQRDYSRTDFARDLYQLETAGATTTKAGARVFFPSSTGARSARNLFTFVGGDGREVKYFAIRFEQPAG